MSPTPTEDQVMTAARELGQEEFTRADIADRLNVERPDLKQGFKAARQAGKVEKIRNDTDGAGLFRLSE